MTDQFPELSTHPFCEEIPAMDVEILNELSEDIEQNGLIDPIMLYEEKILDGKNRYNACRKAGVKPEIVHLAEICPDMKEAKTQEEKDAIARRFVCSRNLKRRNLNESQRVMLVVKFTTLRRGQKKNVTASGKFTMTQKEAAMEASVCSKLVSQARAVMEEVPDRVPNIMAGKTTVSREYSKIQKLKEKQIQQKETQQRQYKFSRPVTDGEYTSETYHGDICAISKLVSQCDISADLEKYLVASATIDTCAEILLLTSPPNLSLPIPLQDMKKAVAALKDEQHQLRSTISDVIEFGNKTYPQWLADLQRAATTDKEKASLAAINKQFEELWEKVRNDTKNAKGQTCTIIGWNIGKVSATKYLDDMEQLLLADTMPQQANTEATSHAEATKEIKTEKATVGKIEASIVESSQVSPVKTCRKKPSTYSPSFEGFVELLEEL